MVTEDDSVTRYRFGPLERRGLVAGWRGGQIATVGAGLVLAVLVLRSDSSITGAVTSLGIVGVAVTVATWPVGGRTVEEWAPDAFRYASRPNRSRRRSRTNPFASLELVSVDLMGSTAETSRRGVNGRNGARDATRGSSFTPFTASGSQRRAGVVVDVASQTYTVVLGVSGAGFVLLGEQDKTERVGAWSGVLSSLSREGSCIHRVQWVQRSILDANGTLVDQLARLHASIHANAQGEPPCGNGHTRNGHASVDTDGGLGDAYRSYEALIHAEAATARRHEVLLAVSVHAGKAARRIKAAGGGESGACALALREAASLRRRLADARVDVDNLLGPEALARTLRSAFASATENPPHHSNRSGGWHGVDSETASPRGDAASRRAMKERQKQMQVPSRGVCRWPWPMGVREEWGRVLIDGTWHCTYWISEWPRTEVGPDFLGPLLLLPEVRRAVSVVMEPLGAAQAARKIEQSRTADVADSELRRRGGFLATARRRREEELLAHRELELTDGHAPFRFSGYVTVSAGDEEELEEACVLTEQAAARCGLELRRCYGDQARAFLATLPLGHGLS